jgi:hypothetical protein
VLRFVAPAGGTRRVAIRGDGGQGAVSARCGASSSHSGK